jgi:hypothetical protein
MGQYFLYNDFLPLFFAPKEIPRMLGDSSQCNEKHVPETGFKRLFSLQISTKSF